MVNQKKFLFLKKNSVYKKKKKNQSLALSKKKSRFAIFLDPRHHIVNSTNTMKKKSILLEVGSR